MAGIAGELGEAIIGSVWRRQLTIEVLTSRLYHGHLDDGDRRDTNQSHSVVSQIAGIYSSTAQAQRAATTMRIFNDNFCLTFYP